MKTAILAQRAPGRVGASTLRVACIAALALLVVAPLVATPVAAHHQGWDCKTAAGHELCTARSLNWTDDCFMRVDGMTWCYQ